MKISGTFPTFCYKEKSLKNERSCKNNSIEKTHLGGEVDRSRAKVHKDTSASTQLTHIIWNSCNYIPSCLINRQDDEKNTEYATVIPNLIIKRKSNETIKIVSFTSMWFLKETRIHDIQRAKINETTKIKWITR